MLGHPHGVPSYGHTNAENRTILRRRVQTHALEGKKAFRVLHCRNVRIGRTVALRETQEGY